MSKSLFARLEPLDPKRGRTTQHVHCEGTLFRGGLQPVWYKVTPELADKLRQREQPSGAPMFQVVDEDTKVARDHEDQARRMVAMGMISDTIHKAAGDRRQEIDLTNGAGALAAQLTGKQPRKPRGGAIPTAEEQDAAVSAAVGAAPSSASLTSADLDNAD